MMSMGLRQKRSLRAVGWISAAFSLLVAGTESSADEPGIERAIKRGAACIERQQLRDGCWDRRGHRLGETALAGLALLAVGYPADHPAVAAAARAVRAIAVSNSATYDLSLTVMFLDQLGDRSDSETIRKLGARFAAGQAADGCWTYELGRVAGNGDNSNTQFAVLACWICRRHGAEMDATILKVDRYFRSTVNQADGGWGYTGGGPSTATMTCAGLVALAAERGTSIQRVTPSVAAGPKVPTQRDGAPRDLAPQKTDPVVARAIAYLAEQLRRNRIEAQSKPFAGLYFFWSLERVAVIYGIGKMEDVDWYAWGAERLLQRQRQDGGWGGNDAVDTAFAILFLAKANLVEDLSATLGGWHAGDPETNADKAGGFLRVEKRRKPSARDEAKPGDGVHDK